MKSRAAQCSPAAICWGAGGGCGAAGEAEYGPPVALGVSDRDLGARAVQTVVDVIVSPGVPPV